MKNILLLAIIITFFNPSYSQNLNGFWDLKFGSTKEQVIKFMLSKPECKFEKQEDENMLIFTGAKFGGEKTSMVFFNLYNDRYYEAVVVYEPTSSLDLISKYLSIKEILNKKYYYSEKNLGKNIVPQDLKNETFLRSLTEKDYMVTLWEFPTTEEYELESDKKLDNFKLMALHNNSIYLSFDFNAGLSLSYTFGKLKYEMKKNSTNTNKDY